MLLHLARISVIAIALALVGGAGFLLSRPSAPTVVTVVVPNSPAIAAAPAATTTVVHQPVYHPYWWSYHPALHACGGRVCWH